MTGLDFVLRTGAGFVAVNTPDERTLLAKAGERMRDGLGFSIATLNLDHIVKLRRSAQFRRVYRNQTFVVADGNPVVWLSRLAQQPVELVAGADLILPLARLAAESGTKVALLGSTDAALEKAGAALVERVPGLEIAARLAPGRNFDPEGAEAGALIAELEASGAGFVFLALGAPRQEAFAARAQAALPHAGFASIGAGLDFLAGHQRRAPSLVRRLALEWVWRMLSNPRRLVGRYAQCAMILPGLALRVVMDRSRAARTDKAAARVPAE